jgi:hypothetical protein
MSIDVASDHPAVEIEAWCTDEFLACQGSRRKSTKIVKGDRVHLSELGCACHPRDSGKEGTVVGHTQYPNSLPSSGMARAGPSRCTVIICNPPRKMSHMLTDAQDMLNAAENVAGPQRPPACSESAYLADRCSEGCPGAFHYRAVGQ